MLRGVRGGTNLFRAGIIFDVSHRRISNKNLFAVGEID